MAQIRDLIMEESLGQMVLTDGQICDAIIALIDSSSRLRVEQNFLRIRLLMTHGNQLSRTARETLTLTEWM